MMRALFRLLGTPNDAVRVKFMPDGVQPPRTADIALPPYFREGINIFDHFKNASCYIN